MFDRSGNDTFFKCSLKKSASSSVNSKTPECELLDKSKLLTFMDLVCLTTQNEQEKYLSPSLSSPNSSLYLLFFGVTTGGYVLTCNELLVRISVVNTHSAVCLTESSSNNLS